MSGSDDEITGTLRAQAKVNMGSSRKSHPGKPDTDDDDMDESSSTESDLSEELVPQQTPEDSGHGASISLDTDFSNVMRMQKQLQNLQKQIDRERQSKVSLDNKRQSLEAQVAELTRKLETLSKDKFQLESTRIDLEAKLRGLQHKLDVEVERRKNAEVIVIRTKEQLTRCENQCQLEADSKLKIELLLRNVQNQLDAKNDALDQVEAEKAELELQLQTGLAERDVEHAETARQTHSQAELEQRAVQREYEQQQLVEENENLQKQIIKLRQDLDLDADTLAETSTQFNLQICTLKAENAKLVQSLSDQQALEAEMKQLHEQLESSTAELEEARRKCIHLERSLEDERTEASQQLEKYAEQLTAVKQEGEKQAQRLLETEHQLVEVEKQLQVTDATHNERTSRLTETQQELDRQKTECGALRDKLREQQEENTGLRVKLETLQDKVVSLQAETVSLKQGADEVQQKSSEQCDQLIALVTNLKQENSQVQSELQRKNVELEQRVEELFERAVTSEAQRDILTRELNDKQTALDDARRQLETVAGNAQQARQSVERDRDEMKSRLERLERHLADTQSKHGEVESSAQSLEDSLRRAELVAEQYKQALLDKEADLNLVLRHMAANNGKLENVVSTSQQQKQQQQQQPLAAAASSSSQSHHQKSQSSPHDAAFSSDEMTSSRKHAKRRKAEPKDRPSDNILMEKQIAVLKAQLRAANKRLKGQGQGSRHAGQSDDLEPLRRHAHQLMTELQQLRHLQKHHSAPDLNMHRSMNMQQDVYSTAAKHGVHLDGDLRAELEARVRLELNRRLAGLNEMLREHSAECEKIDRIRDDNEQQIRKQLKQAEQELRAELSKVRPNVQPADEQQLKSCDETDICMQPLRINDLDDLDYVGRGDSSDARMDDGFMDRNEQIVPTLSRHRVDVGVDASHSLPLDVVDRRSVGVSTGVDMCGGGIGGRGLPMWLQKQLERSIAKHLEKPPHSMLNCAHYAAGSRFLSTAVLDQPARDYLSVLERNYLLT